MAVTGQYLDTRGQPTRQVAYPESWPRAVAFDQYVPIVAGGYQYGGGMLVGPLTAQQVADLTAAGYGSLITSIVR